MVSKRGLDVGLMEDVTGVIGLLLLGEESFWIRGGRDGSSWTFGLSGVLSEDGVVDLTVGTGGGTGVCFGGFGRKRIANYYQKKKQRDIRNGI